MFADRELSATHRFSLPCSYSMGYFYKDAAFDAICREHTHVVAADGEAAAIGAAQATVVR